MTVCKTFNNEKPQRGQKYKKADLLRGYEYIGSAIDEERFKTSGFDTVRYRLIS